MRKMGLVIWFLSTATVTMGDISILQTSIDASQGWTTQFSFAAPSDGKLVFTIGNPDSSADGNFWFHDTPWQHYLKYRMLTGTCPYVYLAHPDQGIPVRTYEFDVLQSYGPLNYDVGYAPSGTQNAGTDSISVFFQSGTLADEPKRLVGSLTSSPLEENWAEWHVTVGASAKLIFHTVAAGDNGGAHSLYVDGRGVTENYAGYQSCPVWSSVTLDAGTHVIRLVHEDDIWGQGASYVNVGIRTTEVYVSALPPVADAGADRTIQCSCRSGGTRVTLDGTGSQNPGGGSLTFVWTGQFAESPASGSNPTVTLGCCGEYVITLVVSDGQTVSEPDKVVITVTDTTCPTITGVGALVVEAQGPSGVPRTASEIVAFLEGVAAADNCDPSPSLSNDAPDDFPLGNTTVVFTAADARGNTSTQVATVTVQDTTPPEIAITAPDPYGVYAAGSLTLNFAATDAVGVTELSAVLVDPAGYSQIVSPGFSPGAGVYTLPVTATDAAGNRAQAEVLFVVYSPGAGFVTGGGWIQSPAGAYVPDPSLTGKATFGFVSRYHRGATVPDGQTEFVFKAGDLNFHSTTYDWLVVTGSNYARFKGTGAINGSGPYKFMLWAGDGPDTFRIKIWLEGSDGTETPVYDNGHDQGIGGGSIVIHDN